MPGGAVGRWLFGKLPSHGDFISRGLDRAVRDRLDHWLSAQMAAVHDLREDFTEAWHGAPAWLFVRPAADGFGWEGGALCASLDRAGRNFPVMMAATAPDISGATGLATGCLAAICEAFEHGRDADWLHGAALDPVDWAWQPETAEWALVGDGAPIMLREGGEPDGLIEAMLKGAA